jgi:hypothetical protein
MSNHQAAGSADICNPAALLQEMKHMSLEAIMNEFVSRRRQARHVVARVLLAAGVLGVFAPWLPAQADVIYTYTGQHFSYVGTGPDVTHVSGFFTLSTPLAANTSAYLTPYTVGGAINNFDFTDGRLTWNIGNYAATWPTSSDSQFFVTTDASGGIANWDIIIEGYVSFEGGDISTCNTPSCVSDGTSIYNNYDAYNFNQPGTWTVSGVAIPEPSSAPLLVAGLLGLVAVVLRRKLIPVKRADSKI